MQYFDEINLHNRVIKVGCNIQIKSGRSPGIYNVKEIQLYNKDIIVYCNVNGKIIAFNEDEIGK